MKVRIGDWSATRPFYDFFEKIGLSNETNHKIHDFLAKLKLIERKRVVKIKLDSWDSYDATATIAMIVVPILKDLKEKKRGTPVSMYPEDHVCWKLETESEEEYQAREKAAGDAAEKLWDEILDKMIFAFESYINTDWEDKFWIVHPELDWNEQEAEKPLKWKVEGQFDREGYDAYKEKIQEGLQLFAKHYGSLWW